MESEVLKSFVKKYYLDGNVEEAKWEFSKDGVRTKFLSNIGDCVGEVFVPTTEFKDDVVVGVLSTSNLLPMIEIMDGLITISIEKSSNGIPLKMGLDNNLYENSYHLADLNLFRKVPRVDEPEYDLEMNISSEFASRFIKGKGALNKEVNRCTIESGTKNNKPGLKVEIGGKESLSHKVKFFHEDSNCKGSALRQSFNADVIKAIFSCNKNFDSGIIKISNQGLMSIRLTSDLVTSHYFVVKMMDSD